MLPRRLLFGRWIVQILVFVGLGMVLGIALLSLLNPYALQSADFGRGLLLFGLLLCVLLASFAFYFYQYQRRCFLVPLQELQSFLQNGLQNKKLPQILPNFNESALTQLGADLQALLQQLQGAELEAHNLAALARHSDNAMIIVDERGLIKWVNPGFCQLTRFRFSEVLGRSPSCLFQTPAIAKKSLRKMYRAWYLDKPYQCELRDSTQHGVSYWVELQVWPVNNKRHCTRHAIVIARDISEVKCTVSALKSSEERFRNLVESSTDWIWETNVHHIYTYISPGVFNLLGYKPEDLLGRSFEELLIQDEQYSCAEIKSRLLTQQPFQGLTYVCRHKNGHEVILESSAVPVFNENRHLIGYRGAHKDISLRLRSRELQELNSHLARAAQMKDEFLANMSHELRTPLHFVVSTAQTLLEETYGPLNSKQEKRVCNIEDSAQHLLSLINDILDLSKIEHGKLDCEFKPVQLKEVCWQSLEFVRQMALEKNLTIETDYDKQVCHVEADERRLKQMLINLLGNAVKFTPENGSIGLRVQGYPEQKQIHIAIWDTGIGIALKDQSRLFTPFEQIDNSLTRKYSGSGLGLALVQRLVTMHQGEILVDSNPDHGSCFTLVLPWDRRYLPQQSHYLAVSKEGFESVMQASPLILIAEDNVFNRQVLVAQLEREGFRTAEAGDGEQALECINIATPDLIIMDLQMPVMDGLEAIRQIRARPELAYTPIIAITALDITSDLEITLKQQVSGYFQKPLDYRELMRMTHQLL